MTFIQTIQTKFSTVVPLGTRGRVSSFSIGQKDLKEVISFLLDGGFRLITMAGEDERQTKNRFTISYIFGFPKENRFVSLVLSVDPANPVFPSVADVLLSARLFGLEIMDMFGLTPEGHPDIELTAQEDGKERRLVHHHNWPKGEYPLRKDFSWNKRPEEANVEFPFLAYSREEGVFEIPVGPIHAGVIEPGHFRFTAVGEMILHLKIRLFYTHRGVEKLFEQKPLDEAVKLAECVAGDSSFSHSLAFCEAAEDLAGIKISRRAGLLRVIFLEMERLYNHAGD
ncbi:MAG TPA: NADH-quinone oxidoreductase subunit C, partial [Candidatus Paceibacterota bacterium]